MTDRADPPADRADDAELALELLLGQLAPADAQACAERASREPGLARALDEQRRFLARMGTLTVHASGSAELALRYACARRAFLRRVALPIAVRARALATTGLRAAAIAALLVGASFLGSRSERADAPMAQELSACFPAAAPQPLDARAHALASELAAEIAEREQRARDASPADVLAFLGADFTQRFARIKAEVEARAARDLPRHDQEFALRQLEVSHCFSHESRRLLVERAGGGVVVEERAQALAGELALRVPEALASGELDIADAALALRAFLASGSTCASGPYREAARTCGHFLERQLWSLRDGELAYALSAFAELAVIHEDRAGTLVAEHAQRLALSILHPSGTQASDLCSWRAELAALAEAGQVLRVAPAFGVDQELAFHARLVVLTHLDERVARHSGERPQLAAAQLYGFGDLLDRAELDRRLLLWRPKLLLPEFVAVHHLTWSQYPLRLGWAEHQGDLRALAAVRTPHAPKDIAALTLSLAMNYAAPGAHELIALADR